MEIYALNNDRMLCWDEFFIDEKKDICIRMHKPTKQNIALACNDEWDGVVNGYACIIKVDDTYRMYYRAQHSYIGPDGKHVGRPVVYCAAESRDGITFKKVKLGHYDFAGTRYNNIFYTTGGYVDNFSVYKDENPACKKEEAYKALSLRGVDGLPKLALFVSEDGYVFTFSRYLDIPGAFDTYNVLFWDKNDGLYHIYYRGNHPLGDKNTDTSEYAIDDPKDIRDVRLAVSEDLITFEVKGLLDFGEEAEDLPLYTNQVTKYYRARDMYIGFPSRYFDRRDDAHVFEDMPLGDRHAFMTKHYGREGTVVTDCAIMTSRDGYRFNRWDEAYLTPEIEARDNWWYGNCFPAHGLIETESDVEGAPNEISFYMGEGYRIKNVNFRRYTVRLDGFFSWRADYKGGTVLTKPFTFRGSQLKLNVATSALGNLCVTVCDETGTLIPGYRSRNVFGDSVSRKVLFEKDLSVLENTPVRLLFEMKDCDLYSFIFE